ncbi:MAG: c-type cytochrome [Bacteroidetes bacterium]|nr:c-type cytochrome [Bacteroidota bacterium]
MKNLFSIKKICLMTPLFLLMHSTMKAAGTEAQPSFWANGPLMLMLLSAIILLIVIIILGKIVSGLIERDTNEVWQKIKENKKLGMLLVLLFSSLTGFSQEVAAEAPKADTGQMFGMDATLFWVMFGVLLFEFIVVCILSYVLFSFLVKKGLIAPAASRLPKWMQFNAMLGNDIPLEKDAELLTDHDYDGIQELDNGMPPMLKYIFVITVLASVVYWINYHVLEASPLPLQEYEIELEQAAIAKEAYLKKAGNSVDENTVTLLTDASMLAAGEKVYTTNCVACHGDKGQGGVGPNFTDQYWLHGGDIKSVFKVVKYGVAAKGMRSWQSEIKPGDMQAVASYILTKLGGTNVAGGKAPQGELYTGAVADTVNVVKDSVMTGVSDTTKK